MDPLAEQTFEPYSYTGNNPIMFTDPTGMSKEGGGDSGGGSWISRAWTEVKSWFGGKPKSTVTVGPAGFQGFSEGTEPEWGFVGAPQIFNGVTKGSVVTEAVTTTAAASGVSLSALASSGALLLASGDTRKDDEGEGYLYRNMRSEGSIFSNPKLGQSANTLGIRSVDVGGVGFSETISGNSKDGLSTTFGVGNYRKDFSVTPQAIPNFVLGKTTLYRIKITDLAPFELKATPINGSYYRITPATNMSIQNFHERIQSTQKLWKIAPANRR